MLRLSAMNKSVDKILRRFPYIFDNFFINNIFSSPGKGKVNMSEINGTMLDKCTVEFLIPPGIEARECSRKDRYLCIYLSL